MIVLWQEQKLVRQNQAFSSHWSQSVTLQFLLFFLQRRAGDDGELSASRPCVPLLDSDSMDCCTHKGKGVDFWLFANNDEYL